MFERLWKRAYSSGYKRGHEEGWDAGYDAAAPSPRTVELNAARERGTFLPPLDAGCAIILTAIDGTGMEVSRFPVSMPYQLKSLPATVVLRYDIPGGNPGLDYVHFHARIVRFDPETDVTVDETPQYPPGPPTPPIALPGGEFGGLPSTMLDKLMGPKPEGGYRIDPHNEEHADILDIETVEIPDPDNETKG